MRVYVSVRPLYQPGPGGRAPARAGGVALQPGPGGRAPVRAGTFMRFYKRLKHNQIFGQV